MPGQAHVASIAALDEFRAKLVVYLSKAGRVLDDVAQEVVATRNWLQIDRQLHWKHEIKKRGQRLSRAEAELLSARLSGHPSAIQERRLEVQRARTAVTEAEQTLVRVKSWLNQYESQVEARLKAVNQLRHVLTQDMKKAAAFLETAGDTLSEYANLASGTPAGGGTENRPNTGPEPPAAPRDALPKPLSGKGARQE